MRELALRFEFKIEGVARVPRLDFLGSRKCGGRASRCLKNAGVVLSQTLSMMMASPCPTPMHRLTAA